METLSICLVTIDFPPNLLGGQGVYTYEIAKGLSKEGHDVKVIAPGENSLAQNEIFKLFPTKKTINPLHFSIFAKNVFTKNIRENIDILHGNAIDHLLFCQKKPKNIKKIVTTSHNTYLQRFYAKNLHWKIAYPTFILLEKIIYNYSDKIIAVSNTTCNSILKYKIRRSKVDIIYNGVNIEKFSPDVERGFLRNKLNLTNSNEKIILFVGRMVKRKGPHILLKACKELINVDPNIHLVLVGKGFLEKKMKKYVYKYRMNNNIHLLGFVPEENLPKIYNDSNLFILPSVGEGLPLTLLEAASSGLFIITTKDATGNTPIIKEGINGYIVKPYNVEELRKKISLSLKNCKKMDKYNRKIILKYFTWKKCIKKTIKTYKSVLLR